MIALLCDANSFSAEPVTMALKSAGRQADEIRAQACTVIYIALERGDTAERVGESIRTALAHRGRLQSPLIVLHSFNHLSDCPAAVSVARRIYEALPEILQGHGGTVVATEFGWIYEIRLHDVGRQGSKVRIVARAPAE